MTTAVSQIGMLFGLLIEGMERTIKDMVMRTLSPRGSRRAPRLDFCLKILATAPSKKSVEIAMIKIMKASRVFLARMKYRKTGLKARRDIEIILGMVMTASFLLFFKLFY
jgi:hypothetical protein